MGALHGDSFKQNELRRRSETLALLEALEIVPPRENSVDALAVETLIASLATEGIFALEIAGDSNGAHFVVRAEPQTLTQLQHQMQAVYDQASFRKLSQSEDPCGQAVAAAGASSSVALASLVLRRPVYLPLRTYRDGEFLAADPIRGLLGAFGDLMPGEIALSQVVLSPAPLQWADRYQGSTRRIDQSLAGEAITLSTLVRQFIAVGTVMFALAFGLWAFFSYLQHSWLSFLIAAPMFIGSLVGIGVVYSVFEAQRNIDPILVQRKVATSAYDVSLRLVAVGKTGERAQSRLRALAASYRQFNLSSGNALVARRAVFDPRVLAIERRNPLQELMGKVMRLNVSELAPLWHLPVGPGIPLPHRNLTRRLMPSPADVGEGVLVGTAVHQEKRISVHIAAETLWHHVFMVAKTQKGKSTLMAHLAAAAMKLDAAVVVVDPHGDLARTLLGLVPKERVGDVLYIDFSDPQQFVGLNLLDMGQGRTADAIVSNIVHVGELLWKDYWGPRMEDALRMALRTLLAANESLVRKHEKQFTLVDIPSLYQLPNFRHRLLKQYVADPEILQWWSGYFERLYESLRMDVINPVLTKIHRFSTHSVVRNIVAQANSTVNFRELLDRRRILLVNTATGVIGPDAGGLLGAVLVDYINFAVREQTAIPDVSARARVVVVVDEFQSIPGVDYPGLLAELQKMGASFILATQALGQLDAINRVLRPAILSNVQTLFVFQTSAEDADLLRHELDDAVTSTDIINLSDHSCYLKTQVGRERLPVMHVETQAPQSPDHVIAEQIVRQMTRYTRSRKIVESERQAFQSEWYGREMSLMKQVVLLKEDTDELESGERASSKAIASATPSRLEDDGKRVDSPATSTIPPNEQATSDGTAKIVERKDAATSRSASTEARTATSADDKPSRGDHSSPSPEKLIEEFDNPDAKPTPRRINP